MDVNVRKKLQRVEILARTDRDYREMYKRCYTLEKHFDKIVSHLSDKEIDVAWSYVMLCQDMSLRKLELACSHMEFLQKEAEKTAFHLDSYKNKTEQLNNLADSDYIFRTWKSSFESYEAAFKAFVDTQPDSIRDFLLGYAQSGQMMLQRKAVLACQHMEFIIPEETYAEI